MSFFQPYLEYYMFKNQLCVLLISVASCFAACVEAFTGGSYVGVDKSGDLYQFIFNENGTVYESVVGFPITAPLAVPEVGTWEIINDQIYATTITLGSLGSEDFWLRTTQKINIINDTTLEIVRFVERTIPTGKNPVKAKGKVLFETNEKITLTLVPVKLEDLNG